MGEQNKRNMYVRRRRGANRTGSRRRRAPEGRAPADLKVEEGLSFEGARSWESRTRGICTLGGDEEPIEEARRGVAPREGRAPAALKVEERLQLEGQ